VHVPKTVRHVWGPVNLAERQRRAFHPREVLRRNSLREASRVHRLIVNNDQALRAFRDAGLNPTLEPNIIVDPPAELPKRDDDLLTISGLLIERKRPWLAIQALKEPALRDFRLQIIGDGPLRPDLEVLARHEGVSKRIHFLGRLPWADSMHRLARSRVLVHPSSREGSPWVVGEAAACGIPSVVFRGSGADTTARLSNNGSYICDGRTMALHLELAQGIESVSRSSAPQPSARWSAARLPTLLKEWWT
jgi:glycosyltransferase involved in cell wall biosynthesis